MTMSTLSLSQPPNHIDLTLDDEDNSDPYYSEHIAKRTRMDPPTGRSDSEAAQHILRVGQDSANSSPSMPRFTPYSQNQKSSMAMSDTSLVEPSPPQGSMPQYSPNSSSNQGMYRPAFAGPSSSFVPHQQPSTSFSLPPRSSSFTPLPSSSNTWQPRTAPTRQIIDLTGSPSPPPSSQARQLPFSTLPPELLPKTPVCIGQLTVTALVLYPVPYLLPQDHGGETDWAPVRLQYEHKPGGSETIHIKAPHGRGPNGESLSGEAFGVVEQKVATSLGPMLGKGLIRLDAKVRKGQPNVSCLSLLPFFHKINCLSKLPILPLQTLVYTPKGNIPVVGNYLQQCGLLLDHPSLPHDVHRVASYHYYNPHNPPPGGHNQVSNRGYVSPGTNMRWSTPAMAGKSVEIQRNQVEELFKNLKDGEELAETEPCALPCMKAYS